MEKRIQSSISFWAPLEQWLDYTSTTRGWSHCRLIWLLWRLFPGTTMKRGAVWKAQADNQLWRRASTIHISALSFSLTGGVSEAGNDTGCFNLGAVSTVAPEAGWYGPLRCDRAACCLWQHSHTNTHTLSQQWKPQFISEINSHNSKRLHGKGLNIHSSVLQRREVLHNVCLYTIFVLNVPQDSIGNVRR